jgi:hypothetical protein
MYRSTHAHAHVTPVVALVSFPYSTTCLYPFFYTDIDSYFAGHGLAWGICCLISSSTPGVSGLPSPFFFHPIRSSSSIRVAIWGRDRRVMAIAGSCWLIELAASFYGRRFLVPLFHSQVSDSLISSYNKGCLFPGVCKSANY